MLNRFARLLLVATSLSPILGAVAVNKFALGKPWVEWSAWLAAAILLVFICWLLLRYLSGSGHKHKIVIKEFEHNDQEMLAFLIAYLLPFISSDNMAFGGQWLTGAYIVLVIFLVVAHSGALHFNPVMGLLGFHFYGVKNENGISQLLISKDELRRPGEEIQTVRVSHNIYLHIKE